MYFLFQDDRVIKKLAPHHQNFLRGLAPYGAGFNNGDVHSLVGPPGNITPIMKQLMVISNGDVEDCQ